MMQLAEKTMGGSAEMEDVKMVMEREQQ